MENQTELALVPEIYDERKLSVSIFDTPEAFEQGQRYAKMLIISSLIPKNYVNNIPNTMIALEYAHRLRISPLMVMQNLNVINGTPSWGASFLIGMINSSGKYTDDLQFEMTGNKGQSDRGCYAWAENKKGKIIEAPEFTFQMAISTGLVDKTGSKWKVTPELMLRYRAASMFSRLHCPEITLGFYTTEELLDEKDNFKKISIEVEPIDPAELEAVSNAMSQCENVDALKKYFAGLDAKLQKDATVITIKDRIKNTLAAKAMVKNEGI